MTKNEKGLLSLEACIVVTMFMFMMLFLYSFFIVFEAQNELAHATLSACNGLSLDTYAAEKTVLSNEATTRGFFSAVYGISGIQSSPFSNYGDWYKSERFFNSGSSGGNFDGTIYASDEARDEVDKKAQAEADANGLKNLTTRDTYGNYTSAVNTDMQDAIEERFIAYVSGGDRELADRILDRLHIVNGVDGLDFSSSYISSGRLYVVLKCELEYEFNFFGMKSQPIKLTACSKLW